MPTVSELHDLAMWWVSYAHIATLRGRQAEASPMYARALPFEVAAARKLEPLAANEPTRGILFRSASWIARHAGDRDFARRLAEEGLRGSPPPLIRRQLEEARDGRVE